MTAVESCTVTVTSFIFSGHHFYTTLLTDIQRVYITIRIHKILKKSHTVFFLRSNEMKWPFLTVFLSAVPIQNSQETMHACNLAVTVLNFQLDRHFRAALSQHCQTVNTARQIESHRRGETTGGFYCEAITQNPKALWRLILAAVVACTNQEKRSFPANWSLNIAGSSRTGRSIRSSLYELPSLHLTVVWKATRPRQQWNLISITQGPTDKGQLLTYIFSKQKSSLFGCAVSRHTICPSGEEVSEIRWQMRWTNRELSPSSALQSFKMNFISLVLSCCSYCFTTIGWLEPDICLKSW